MAKTKPRARLFKDGWAEIKAAAGEKPAELLIYGDIGENWWSEETVTAKGVVDALAKLDAEEDLTVRINSYGGVVADGIAITNAIKRHKGKTTGFIDGVAMSAASMIAMGVDELNMPSNAMMMIHAPWGFTIGNAEDHRVTAETLDKFADAMITTYTRGGAVDPEYVADMLKDGKDHYFTAEEAVEAKLADSVTDALDVAASVPERYQAALSVQIKPSSEPEKLAPILKQYGSGTLIIDSARDETGALQTVLKRTEGKEGSQGDQNIVDIQAAAVAKEKERETGRKNRIMAGFAPVMALAPYREVLGDLRAECLADGECTPEAAMAKALAQLGKDTVPLAGTRIVRREDEATETFESLVEKKIAGGMKTGQARAAIARERPDLHQEWLDRINAKKSD